MVSQVSRIIMVSLVSRINSIIVELVSHADLKEHQTMEVIVRVIRIIIVELVSHTDLKEHQTIEVIVWVIRIIIVTFPFISFKINLL